MGLPRQGPGLPAAYRPALQIDELPDLDLIVLSHMHGDHWDRNARRGLDRNVPIHHSDYGVFKSPLAAFRAEMEERGLAGLVDCVEPGRTTILGPASGRPAPGSATGK